MTSESRNGPTPNGGVRSTIYYLDADGNEADKASATQARIVEYDAAGDVVFRTYARLGEPAPKPDATGDIVDVSRADA